MKPSLRVLLADARSPALQRTVRALEKNRLAVEVVHGAGEALAAHAQNPADVVVVGQKLPQSARFAVCGQLKQQDPAAVIVGLAQDPRGQAAAQRAGADATLVRPVADAALLASVRALSLVRPLRQAVAKTAPIFDEATGFYAFEHFRAQLFVELKRSKRYQLPVAVLLASIEAPTRAVDAELNTVLMGGLAVAVRASTRGTDLPVAYGDRNVLILLPHTDGPGAESVGRRVLFKIARSPLRHANRRLKPRISLGLAAAPDGARPFSDLMREATARLKEAEARGGNCIVGDPA